MLKGFFFLYVTLYGEWTDTLKHINQNLFTLAGCFYYFNSTINPILYSVMSNRFRVAFREKLCAGPPSLWCICCCCFCCVKDFEKRSQQTPVFCRNSNSHSSVRSCVSYHKTNLITNNNRPRTLAVDYNQKLGVTMSCVHRDQVWTPTSSVRKYGPTLTVSPPISSQQHESSHSHRSSSSDTHRRNCQGGQFLQQRRGGRLEGGGRGELRRGAGRGTETRTGEAGGEGECQRLHQLHQLQLAVPSKTEGGCWWNPRESDLDN
ncbi:g_PROTEIN_RECEP_F1_2 domain-containing protein [Caerostris extrusa]|uniref:G_PROTEIN_RECEP_F1_2 domain-containing protein n=1 Tax=Caerostris extrusa TaxID=172846 RepID=A0AAV4NN38_CAEEX|nr:g_PROTEIN_RECEP_F1_2 domain-containing protein [Caerostris extrusa]